MPNIELPRWQDRWTLDDIFWYNIAQSVVRHLSISWLPMRRDYSLPRKLVAGSWPLQSLSLHLESSSSDTECYRHPDERPWPPPADPPTNHGFKFIGFLLRLCASTLRSFVWSCITCLPRRTVPTDIPRSSCLRTLYLRINLPPDALAALLGAPLKKLDVSDSNHHTWPPTQTSLGQCSSVEGLEVVRLAQINAQTAASITEFLTKNTHIQKLHVGRSSTSELNSRLLPLLSNGEFNGLTSLSLHWDDHPDSDADVAYLTEASLNALGAATQGLSNLQQLKLAVSLRYGSSHWLIDHEVIRGQLCYLQCLKEICFSGDPSSEDSPSPGGYYQSEVVTMEDERQPRKRSDLDRELDVFETAARCTAQERALRRREAFRQWADVVDTDTEEDFSLASDDSDDDGEEDEDDGSVEDGDDLSDDQDSENPTSERHHDLGHLDPAMPKQSSTSYDDLTLGDDDPVDDDISPDDLLSEPEWDDYYKLGEQGMFELAHRNRMLEQAETYAAVFPALKKMYCGQWCIKIKVLGDGSFGNAVPISEECEERIK